MSSAHTGIDGGASAPSAGTTTQPPSGARTRRRLVLAAAAALLVVALVAVLLLTGGDDEDPGRAAVGSAAPSTSAPGATGTVAPTSAPEATDAAPNDNELPPARPAVALDAQGEVGNGIVVAIPAIDAIQGAGQGPGNVAGPALRVTVRITNGTDADVALGGVAVNLSYGSEATPASPLDDPSQRPFTGSVAPGGQVDAVYVFSVPTDARENVTIDVGYQPGAPRVLFTGRAA